MRSAQTLDLASFLDQLSHLEVIGRQETEVRARCGGDGGRRSDERRESHQE